ncbi:MAG: phosphate ABC transporter permease subunit PstC [Actinobacteria bacterium]|nr:phosphate ABC transporter permease subunit PstC [Actinomycetota bacterium]
MPDRSADPETGARVSLLERRPGGGGNADLTGLRSSRGAGRGDAVFGWIALGAGITVLAVLGLIALSTTKEALPAFQQQGPSFVWSNDWNPNQGKFGALAFIYGTVLVSFIAILLSVPVSLGIALFTNEVAPRRLRRAITYVVDLLAAIPSVVYGLWGLLVLAPAIKPVYESIAGTVGSWPVLSAVLGGKPDGKSFMTAGIILAIMITPIITSLSREVIATVPAQQREAAMALGATRWEMIRASVIPWSRSGIVGAVMLGLGRAMGETIAAALVIGSSAQITLQVFDPGDAMPAYIANQFGEASGTFRSALIGLGVVLFAITIAVNLTARSVVTRFDLRTKGV